MSDREHISDEELERFKDFDGVLRQYQVAGGGVTLKLLKLILPVAVMISVVLYFTLVDRSPEHDQQQQTIQSKDSVQYKPDQLKTEPVTDSGKEKPVVTTPEEKSEQITVPAKPVQPDEKIQPTEKDQPLQVYVQAEPVDGYDDLYQYFAKELVYPPVAVKDSIQGVITVSFIISKTAKIESIRFVNSLGKPFEDEATRLILNMPPWKAATLNGQPVVSKISLPITFQLHPMKSGN